jgi:hypothetical protein
MELSGQLHDSFALPRGKSPRYPLDRKMDGTQSQSEVCGVEKSPLPLPGVEPRPFSPSLRRLNYLSDTLNYVAVDLECQVP